MILFNNDYSDTWYWITNDEDTPMSPEFDNPESAHMWLTAIREAIYKDSVQVPRTLEQAGVMMRLAQMYFESNPGTQNGTT